MGVVEDLTPVYFEVIRLVISFTDPREDPLTSIELDADISILNAAGKQLQIVNVKPTATAAQETAFLNWAIEKISEYATAQGLTRFTE